MNTLKAFLDKKDKGKSSIYFILSGIVVSGTIEDYDDYTVTISEAIISGEKVSLGITTIPIKNILAYGDGPNYAKPK